MRSLLLSKFLLLALIVANVAIAQAPDREALARPGPYQVAYFSQVPDVPEFGAATLYFPANKGDDFGGVVVSPGFYEQQENMQWWGNHLASHGYAVLTIDTNALTDDPSMRADALMAGVELLRAENTRMGSTLRGKILTDRMAVMGHSMGGGGTLLAANEHSDELKAIIPFTPWQPNADFSSVSVPTLLIAGEIDRIAPNAEHSRPHYESLADDLTKMYLEVKGGNHFIANSEVENERLNPNMDVHDLVGTMAVAWLKLFVDEDESYRDIVFGEMPEKDSARLSRFEFTE